MILIGNIYKVGDDSPMLANSGSLNLLNIPLKQLLLNSVLNTQSFMVIHSYINNLSIFLIAFYTITLLYHQPVQWWRQLLAAVICSSLYQLPIFIAHIFMTSTTFLSISLVHWLVYYPPYFLIVLYLISIYILKINRYKCIHTINHVYYIIMTSISLYYLIESTCFYLLTDDKQYQFFVFVTTNTIIFTFMFSGYSLLVNYIKKNLLWLEDYIQRPHHQIIKNLLCSSARSLFIFTIHVLVINQVKQSTDIVLIISSLFLLCAFNFLQILLTISQHRLTMHQYNIENKKLHIASLIESINKFSGVKHDFNNIMQVYDGYISIGSYERLKEYHRSVYKLVQTTSTNIELTKKMPDNPALYSILLAKSHLAASHNVVLQSSCMADASRLLVHPLDLSRIIGILLDNAIEESSKTDKKTVHFYMEQKSDTAILLSISNPTVNDVDPKSIFQAGYTTKENHSGIGLYHLWSFVSATKNCTLTPVYLNNTITFYLELACASQGEAVATFDIQPVLSNI